MRVLNADTQAETWSVRPLDLYLWIFVHVWARLSWYHINATGMNFDRTSLCVHSILW